MTSERIKERIKRLRMGETDVRIGKNGISDGVINEIKRRLKEHEVVKVRIGMKDLDRREVAQRVASLTNSKVIEVRGYTFILKKIDSS
ncbi:MAG: YhbY family RNA-binding protein [Candidatus Aramenus sulfurataquae]|nr:YhbY family RNA-binding protein [Candidatus Aramenus sp.]MCL7343720.1 YhbY family RNA-binding protein [Candidatus Aramenus sulfurataquae]